MGDGIPASFWVIAALAVIVDVRPFNAPGREPDTTVYSSIAFSFALLLCWGLGPAVAVQSAAGGGSSGRVRPAPPRGPFKPGPDAPPLFAAGPLPHAPHPPAPPPGGPHHPAPRRARP